MNIQIPINNKPKAKDFWKGIGGHFDNISQIACEFIDNSLSNIIGSKSFSKTIIIRITQKKDNILMSFEDSGSGIKDLDSAFALGNTNSQDSPLNEHGFGMKHALAAANPTNDDWQIYTRTKEDFNNRIFKKITSSYEIENFSASVEKVGDPENWPGDLNNSGTLVRFSCSTDLFNTLAHGVSGPKRNFFTLLEYFKEDLGFIYSGLITQNKAAISIIGTDLEGTIQHHDVAAVNPNWDQYYYPGQGSEEVDLGGGTVKILYEFGRIKEADYRKYYKKNISSSGVEIRINGRVLEYNLFKEVWGVEPHNQFNHLLIKVDIVSDKKNALPTTTTAKNGIRQGDPKFNQLLKWILTKMKNPEKELSSSKDEGQLVEVLANAKKTHLPQNCVVKTEEKVFKNIKEKVPVDLYLQIGGDVILYEAKKDKTGVQDVYQLEMYWDGFVLDGIEPTKGILIASHHPDSVKELVSYLNQKHDFNGKKYNFELKTWKEEGVDYPKL
jgi:hypothetical protein